jgi:hypothetical protein
MTTVYCDNCGTSLLEETAKFCRACGKPTPLSEAATKRFDEQPVLKNPTNPVAASFTSPAYMAPFEMPQAHETNDLRQKKQKRNIIIVVSMMAVMIIALVGLLLFLNFDEAPPDLSGGPTPVAGAPPPPPDVPGAPPPPPAPPGISPSLIYPGATQTMLVNEAGARVLQLTSNDPATRVSDWYISRLKSAKKVTILGQTILQAGDTNVVITGGDSGTQIIITRAGEN